MVMALLCMIPLGTLCRSFDSMVSFHLDFLLKLKCKLACPHDSCPFNLKNQHCMGATMVCHSTSAWAYWNYGYVEHFVENPWGVSGGSSGLWACGGRFKAISRNNCALDLGLEWNFEDFGDALETFSSCAEGKLMTPIFFFSGKISLANRLLSWPWFYSPEHAIFSFSDQAVSTSEVSFSVFSCSWNSLPV